MKNDAFKCFKVTLKSEDGSIYYQSLMTCLGESSAKKSAEFSLLEGQHIKAKAIDITEIDSI